MLSLGGDSYTEGGFTSAALATAGADKIWAMFGPVQSGSSALRPFGSAVLDGFDFDFEANVQNMATFANELRRAFPNEISLLPANTDFTLGVMNAAGGKKYYLSAAPQCPFPDLYNKDIIDNVPLDFVNVQYYNNGCGASSYVPGATTQWNFNFNQWDTWASSASKSNSTSFLSTRHTLANNNFPPGKNPAVKVLLGVPANTGAGRGYLTPSQLAPVIQFSAKYKSFGGVMMWDASQAYTNSGFISGVKSTLRSLTRRAMRWGARADE
jgi:chitinase